MPKMSPKHRPGLTVAEITSTGSNRFSVSGDLGFASIPALLSSSQALFNGVDNAEVDLEAARALDSSAVALLVEWARLFDMKGGDIVFRNVPDQFRQIAAISEIDRVLNIS